MTWDTVADYLPAAGADAGAEERLAEIGGYAQGACLDVGCGGPRGNRPLCVLDGPRRASRNVHADEQHRSRLLGDRRRSKRRYPHTTRPPRNLHPGGDGALVRHLKHADLGGYRGLDLAGRMVKMARKRHPDLQFAKAGLFDFLAKEAGAFDTILFVASLQVWK